MGEFVETMGLDGEDDSIGGNDIGAVTTLEGVIGEREYGNESNQNGWQLACKTIPFVPQLGNAALSTL